VTAVVISVGMLAAMVDRLWTRDGHWVFASIAYGLTACCVQADVWTSWRRLRVLADGR
jgi:hypothetical protein